MDRYNRQIAFFGEEGQLTLQKTIVAIIGLGGIGSHVAQQLAHLGISNIIIVDNDILENTNRNRLIGVTEDDPIGMPKVDIIERLILGINPKIQITKYQSSFINQVIIDDLKKATVIFGCVDNDGPRMVLNNFCLTHNILLFDLATEIGDNGSYYGGRVTKIDSDTGCLYCLGEIDGNEARKYFENSNEKTDRLKIYGVEKVYLRNSGPSVVSLNGVIASLAVSEFLYHITGIRVSSNIINYYGDKGIVTKNNDSKNNECYFCKTQRGRKDLFNVSNYINE